MKYRVSVLGMVLQLVIYLNPSITTWLQYLPPPPLPLPPLGVVVPPQGIIIMRECVSMMRLGFLSAVCEFGVISGGQIV